MNETLIAISIIISAAILTGLRIIDPNVFVSVITAFIGYLLGKSRPSTK